MQLASKMEKKRKQELLKMPKEERCKLFDNFKGRRSGGMFSLIEKESPDKCE